MYDIYHDQHQLSDSAASSLGGIDGDDWGAEAGGGGNDPGPWDKTPHSPPPPALAQARIFNPHHPT